MGRRPKSANASDSPANPTENPNPPSELLSPQPKMQKKSPGSSSRKKNLSITRRSERLRSLPRLPRNQDVDAVMEDIVICDSEKEEDEEVPYVLELPSEKLDDKELPIEEFDGEELPSEKLDDKELPIEELDGEELPPEELDENASLEEKVNYLLRTVKKLMSQARNKHAENDNQSAEVNYKSLYFDSQKKIEALIEENRELSNKHNVALAKAEAYGKANKVCLDVLAKVKDSILVSSLAKINEAAMNVSSQAMFHKCSSAPGGDATSEPPVAEGERQASPESRKRKKSTK